MAWGEVVDYIALSKGIAQFSEFYKNNEVILLPDNELIQLSHLQLACYWLSVNKSGIKIPYDKLLFYEIHKITFLPDDGSYYYGPNGEPEYCSCILIPKIYFEIYGLNSYMNFVYGNTTFFGLKNEYEIWCIQSEDPSIVWEYAKYGGKEFIEKLGIKEIL